MGSLRRGEAVDARFDLPGRSTRVIRIHHRVTRVRTARPRTVTLTVLARGHRVGGALVLRPNERPTAWIENPVRGEIVSGIVPAAATASGGTPIAYVQFSVDGRKLGRRLTHSPYAVHWDTRRLSREKHTLAMSAVDVAGHSSLRRVKVVVQNPAPRMTCFVMQAHLTSRGQGTVTTPAFRTALPGETLLALVSADGPAAGRQQTATVSGGVGCVGDWWPAPTEASATARSGPPTPGAPLGVSRSPPR